MSGTDAAASRQHAEGPRPRQAKQLLLALFGELLAARVDVPVRAGVLLDVLAGAGVGAPAARATLQRLSRNGVLERIRLGREIAFVATPMGRDVLSEGGDRVNAEQPFLPRGEGWTLVTFTVPERHRTLRHRLRASLTWEGFAPLRDGLWIAPGSVDLEGALGPLSADLPAHSVTAFRARDLEAYPVSRGTLREAWDIEGIRAEHLRFLRSWAAPDATEDAQSALAALVCLLADWIALLRVDPRLPSEFMEAAWPAERSTAVYRARRNELRPKAEVVLAALLDEPASLVP